MLRSLAGSLSGLSDYRLKSSKQPNLDESGRCRERTLTRKAPYFIVIFALHFPWRSLIGSLFGKLNRTTSPPAAVAADPGTGSRRPVTGVTGNIASGLVFKPNAGDRVRGFCQRMHRHRAESAGHARWGRNVADGPGLVSNRSGHGRAERRG